jgi:MinD-like ATPase involved in chromosome partitioning or flagellar assembly
MKMKNLDIEMHNTLDITNMTQKEIEEAIHSVLSGEKTFEEVASDHAGPSITIEEPTDA